MDGVSVACRLRSLSPARSATSSGTFPRLRTWTSNVARRRDRITLGAAVTDSSGRDPTTTSTSWWTASATPAWPVSWTVIGWVPAGKLVGRSRRTTSCPVASGKSASTGGPGGGVLARDAQHPGAHRVDDRPGVDDIQRDLAGTTRCDLEHVDAADHAHGGYDLSSGTVACSAPSGPRRAPARAPSVRPSVCRGAPEDTPGTRGTAARLPSTDETPRGAVSHG